MNRLEKYADVLLQCGCGLKEGQDVFVQAPVSAYEFVRLVSKRAYELGAHYVFVRYTDSSLKNIRLDYSKNKDTYVEPFATDENIALLERDTATLILDEGPFPESTNDPEFSKVLAKAEREDKMRYRIASREKNGMAPRCLAMIPSQKWAEICFPDSETPLKDLWEKIFTMCDCNEEDPVASWKKRSSDIETRANILNNLQFDSLVFEDGKTSMTTTMPENHQWVGGGVHAEDDGRLFMPNFPTEEIFSGPAITGVNGTLCASRPLWHGGHCIKDIVLQFKDGKVVSASASEGQEWLHELLHTDEASCYAGEIAILPGKNNVGSTGMVYNTTLLDENAGCHLALGCAYACSIKGNIPYTKESLNKHGLNYSTLHCDIVFGTEYMNIKGIKDGKEYPILENGEWKIG